VEVKPESEGLCASLRLLRNQQVAIMQTKSTEVGYVCMMATNIAVGDRMFLGMQDYDFAQI